MDVDEIGALYESQKNELQVCKQKLVSKCEALLILSKEVDQCRGERDQFKLMAEQLRERYQVLKRQRTGMSPHTAIYDGLDPSTYTDKHSQDLVQRLCEAQEQNKGDRIDLETYKQQLVDAQGDIKLLREQIVRQRIGSTDEGMNPRHFPAYEREELVAKLEASRNQVNQLERDLQQVIDEKEEQETERDVYKIKYERLNQELNYILRGDQKRVLDIDALVTENKYLKDRMKQFEEEKAIATATISKYKNLLDRKKNRGILKLGQNRSGGVVISQNQANEEQNLEKGFDVKQLLQDNPRLPCTQQTVRDLQALSCALLDAVTDKNLALQHQRKTNKILGARVSELDNKVKTLEVAGLWTIPANMANLEKLRTECEEVRDMIPNTRSLQSSEGSQSTDTRQGVGSEELHSDWTSPLESVGSSTSNSPSHSASGISLAAGDASWADAHADSGVDRLGAIRSQDAALSASVGNVLSDNTDDVDMNLNNHDLDDGNMNNGNSVHARLQSPPASTGHKVFVMSHAVESYLASQRSAYNSLDNSYSEHDGQQPSTDPDLRLSRVKSTGVSDGSVYLDKSELPRNIHNGDDGIVNKTACDPGVTGEEDDDVAIVKLEVLVTNVTALILNQSNDTTDSRSQQPIEHNNALIPVVIVDAVSRDDVCRPVDIVDAVSRDDVRSPVIMVDAGDGDTFSSHSSDDVSCHNGHASAGCTSATDSGIEVSYQDICNHVIDDVPTCASPLLSSPEKITHANSKLLSRNVDV